MAQTGVPFGWTLVPPDVSPGESFRLLFATSTRRNATSTDIADYNAFVQGRAAAGHADIRRFSSGFRVVGCTETVDARDNTSSTYTAADKGVPIYWLGGAQAADDYEDFYDGSWDSVAGKNESGGARSFGPTLRNKPFTGCRADGTERAGSALGERTVEAGDPAAGKPFSDGTTDATSTRPFYALSEVFQFGNATGKPSITGRARVGQILTASTGGIADADGLTGVRFTYQWIRVDSDGTSNPTEIMGATDSTYTLAAADEGKKISVRVEYADDAGNAELLTSDAYPSGTGTVAAATLPPPVIARAVTVPADWSLKPSGLGTGDTFRLLFVTSSTRRPNSADIGVFNTFVQTAAAAGHADIQDYSSHFRVVGCTPAVDARDNTSTTYMSPHKGVPIYWLNGAKVADHYADFYDGSWDSSASKNASGTDRSTTSESAYPATGCTTNGTEAFSMGVSRGLRPSTVDVAIGDPARNPMWILGRNRNTSRPYYALSPLFRVQPNRAATGTPGISGTAEVGQVLTAYTGSIADADGLDNATYAYRWIRVDADGASNPVDIAGATGNTYTLAAADVGKKIKVKVSFTDDAGGAESLTSGAHPAGADTVGARTLAPGAPVAVDVTAAWGLVPSGLSAGDSFRLLFATSTKRDARPSNIAQYNTFVQTAAAAGHADIQAYSSGFRVVGCTPAVDARDNTATTYTTADKGVPIYWLDGAKAADDYADFYDGSWDSVAGKDESGTDRNLDGANRPFTGCNKDGREWFSGTVSGALSTPGAIGVQIGLPSSGTPFTGASARRRTERPFYALSQVFRIPTFAATGKPTISGTAEVGQVLTAFTGGIADADGLADDVTYTYQWIRVDSDGSSNATDITGATASSYTPVAADQGKKVKVKVSFTDANGNDEELTSDAYPAGADTIGARTLPPGAVGPASVPTNWRLIPSGRSVGDSFRLLFATSTERNATSTDIADYNTFVQGRAAAGHADIQAYSSGFRVVGCTSAVDARDNTATTHNATDRGVPIYWLNGVQAADDYVDFYDGSWASISAKNESGGSRDVTGGDRPFTGCAADGTESFVGNASRALGSSQVKVAQPSTGRPLTSGESGASSQMRPFYALSQVFRVVNHAPTGTLEISGTARVGELLTASRADIADADGLTGVSYSYQWIRVDADGSSNPTDIPGATSTAYTLVAADRGRKIKVKMSFTDDVGNAEALTSAATAEIAGRSAAPPVIAGERVWSATMGVGNWYTEFTYHWVPNVDDPTLDEYVETVVEASERERGYRREHCVERLGQTDPENIEDRSRGDTCYGSLDDNDFELGGATYAIEGIYHFVDRRNGGLTMDFTSAVDVSALDGMVLAIRVDNGKTESVPVNDRAAGLRCTPQCDKSTMMLAAPEAWTVGSAVALALVRPASEQGAIDPPVVTGTPALSEAGADGQWTEGETVEVTLTFSEAVTVSTTGGTPSVGIALGGTEAKSAPYLRGSGTAELVFGYTLAAGDGSHSAMSVTADSLALNGGTIRSVATQADATLAHNGAAVVAAVVLSGPTASFGPAPSNHDGTAFDVELIFSEAPEAMTYRSFGNYLDLSGATVTARRKTPGSNAGWVLTVTPTSATELVSVAVPIRECSADHAICVGGVPLSVGAALLVLPAQSDTAEVVQFSPSFSGAPAEHDGTTAFTLDFDLGAEPDGMSWRTVRDSLFTVTGGDIAKASRKTAGKNRSWKLDVEPDGFGAVTLSLVDTTDCSGTPGVCTPGGAMLTGPLSLTVQGPVTLSVADAEVEEAADAALGFTVSMSRARTEATTVDYATSDGTATAGTDYTATSGTLTFAANETLKTVSVPVLDDAHDEGRETLTLTLSNPSPSTVKLADATATGTITNDDLMPQAWLARFGRTVGEQAIEAVQGRMGAGRTPSVEVSLAGERIGWRPGGDGDAGARETALREAEAERAAARLAAWLEGAGSDDGPGLRSRAVTGDELLFGSSFSLTGGSAETGFASFWGRGAVTAFDGREDDMTLEGEVASAMLGTDFSRGRVLGGLMLSHSRGDGRYRDDSGRGTVESSLTALFPYAQYALTERVSAWGLAGYGEGTLTLTPEGQPALRPDMDFAMGALGLRGVLVDGGADGLTLSVKSDAMAVRTGTEAVSGADGNLAASEADVTRLRLGVEGARPIRLSGTAVLTPSLELGARHDGGDAETGFGADIGAGLALADPARGVSADLRARGMLTHEADGFRDRGVSGTLAFDPTPESERGLNLSLTQSMGAPASGGADALLGRRTLAGLAAGDRTTLDARRLDARLGYGFAAFGDRYTATPELGLGLAGTERELRLGWRLAERVSSGLALTFGVEGTRREPANDPGSGSEAGSAPEHGLSVGAGWRLVGRNAGSFELRFEATRLEAANGDTPPEHGMGARLTARW